MPTINWNEILPVLVSICIIIAVAVLKKVSSDFAAIAATMPINIPLGMWVFMSGGDKTNEDLTKFTGAIFINMMPTLLFIVAAWFVLRNGGNIIIAIAIGYLTWALALALLYFIKHQFGIS
jgi:hypothetical protein